MANNNQAKKSTSGAVWPLVLSYLTSFLLVGLGAVLILYSTLCRPGYMQGRVRSSGFARTAYEAMREDFISYGAATGFSADTMTAAISQGQIELDMEAAITRMYEGTLATDPHSEVAEAAYAAMQAEAEARGVAVEGDAKEAVETVAEAVRQEYAGYTALPLVSQLYTIIQKLEKVIWVGVILGALLTAASVWLLLRFCRRDARLGARCLVFALGGAALVCLVLGLAVNPLMGLQRLNFNPLALKNLIISYVQGIFGSFNLFAAIYVVLALLLGELLMPRKRKNEPKRYVMDAENNPMEPPIG